MTNTPFATIPQRRQFIFFGLAKLNPLLENRNRLTSKRSPVNWQIQLIEHYCTGLEHHFTEYSSQLNYCLLFHIWPARMD